MIPRLSDSRLLQPCDIQPSQRDWEVIGVFNPAVVRICDEIVMLARVAERPIENRPGWTPLPRWKNHAESTVDWVRDEDLRKTDARVVELKHSGDLRLTSVSHFQIFRQSDSGDPVWKFIGVLLPKGSSETYGIEDPRVTRIEDTYWITYVAVSRSGVGTALMSTTDFVNFHRHGIIFACENKDVVLFPERIAGDYVALHRPNPNSHFSPPQIWIARSPDLIHWGRHEPIFHGVESWEGNRIGSGTPPVLVDEGWLTLYHGSAMARTAGTVGLYAAGALLLDRADPSRVIARTRQPVLAAVNDYETDGFVPNVVFPTAILGVGNAWHVYYGAADTAIAMTRLSKRSVMNALND